MDACDTSSISDDYIKGVAERTDDGKSKVEATSERSSNIALTVLTPGSNVFEAERQTGSRFTKELLQALAEWHKDDWDWNWLVSRLKQNGPDTIRIMQSSGAARGDELPFTRPNPKLPTRPEDQLRLLVEESEPTIALGAVIGASKLDRRLSEVRLPNQIVSEISDFTGGRSLSSRFLHDDEGLANWRTLKALVLFPNLPFDRITDIGSSVSEALSMALARIILGNTKPEDKVELNLSDFDVDMLSASEAIQVLSGYSYEIEEVHRFNSVFRVLIAYCRPKEEIGGEPLIVGVRFFRHGGSTDLPEELEERVKREYAGVSIVSKLYGTNEKGRIIYINRDHDQSNGQTNEGSFDSGRHGQTCNSQAIGTAYFITKSREKMKTLATFLTSRFSIVDAESIQASKYFVLEMIDGLYKELNSGRVEWALGRKSTPFNWHGNEAEKTEEYRDSFQRIADRSFGGYDSQTGCNAHIVGYFLRKFDETVKIPEQYVPLGNIHGDMHQQNILLPDGIKKFDRGKPLAMIDFEASKSNGYVFADMASLEVAFSVFWLADMIGMKRLLEIASEATHDDVNTLKDGDNSETEEIPDDEVDSGREMYPARSDYKGYDGVAYEVLVKFRNIFDDIVTDRPIFQDLENRLKRSEEGARSRIDEETKRLLYRQYFIQLTLRAASLISVEGAPKAAVVEYAAWLVRQLQANPVLAWQPGDDS